MARVKVICVYTPTDRAIALQSSTDFKVEAAKVLWGTDEYFPYCKQYGLLTGAFESHHNGFRAKYKGLLVPFWEAKKGLAFAVEYLTDSTNAKDLSDDQIKTGKF